MDYVVSNKIEKYISLEYINNKVIDAIVNISSKLKSDTKDYDDTIQFDMVELYIKNTITNSNDEKEDIYII